MFLKRFYPFGIKNLLNVRKNMLTIVNLSNQSLKIIFKQEEKECIPVGCVPPAAVAVGGVSPGTPPTRYPPEQTPPPLPGPGTPPLTE